MNHPKHTLYRLALGALLLAACQAQGPETAETTPADAPAAAAAPEDLTARAQRLAQEILIVDTHVDVPYRLVEKMEDVSQRTESGDFDFPRAREGGLDLPFMSIYIPARYEDAGAKKLADELIDMVDQFATDWPDKFVRVDSTDEVEAHFGQDKVMLALGMENGAPIEGDLGNLKYFHDRGIRYITLTHSENNHISDSSYADGRKWNGLSPFGREVVAEMNRLGIMIDVSHVSDEAFEQVIELTEAPVIASHSSARAFTPDWERNMSDAMIERLAENGGVIHINFGSAFLTRESHAASTAFREARDEYQKAHDLPDDDPRLTEFSAKYFEDNPPVFADVADVVAHIDHVVELVGIDHVGLGSDFDGVGDSLPTGLKDVSYFPNLIAKLLEKGYSEDDVRKICGENLMRVWRRVEQLAAESS